MFHVELRQFPNQTRAFNLTREELESRVLSPWVAGTPVEMGDRRWAPDRARLSIYEGPALGPEQIGLGRGWANATRTGQDVTTRLLEEVQRGARGAPALQELKAALLERCARGPMEISAAVELAGDRYAGSRVSDRLALAEGAVWELLHEKRMLLVRGGTAVPPEEWQPMLLSWMTWAAGEGISLETAPS